MATKARIEAPKPGRAQAHVDGGPSFLSLPLEVRIMIYRLLLVADKPLACGDKTRIAPWDKKLRWARFGEYDLQPAILCVCLQIHREASPILYRENTAVIQVYGLHVPTDNYTDDTDVESEDTTKTRTEARTLFMNFELLHGNFRGPPPEQFQRVEIAIDTIGINRLALRGAITTLCSSVLCRMPVLQHISIHLYTPLTFRIDHLALTPFEVLRNLRSVYIYGTLPPFEERLKGQMLSNASQETIEKIENMYRLVEQHVNSHVNSPKGGRLELQRASNALQEWDIQKFEEIRSQLRLDGRRRMEDALHDFFD